MSTESTSSQSMSMESSVTETSQVHSSKMRTTEVIKKPPVKKKSQRITTTIYEKQPLVKTSQMTTTEVGSNESRVNTSQMMVTEVVSKSQLSGSMTSLDSIGSRSMGRGTKPYFIRKLPSRVEMLEGESFNCDCSIARGCKPWFIKKLPPKIAIVEGHNIETTCVLRDIDEETMSSSDIVVMGPSRLSSREGSEASFRLVGKREGVPLCPALLRVTHQTLNSATIEWAKPLDDGGDPVTHYILEKRETSSPKWTTLTTLPPTVMECELENMAAGREYLVRIKAVNVHGVSEPKELTEAIVVQGAKKEVPSKPGRPTVLDATDKHITVTWEPPVSDGGCPILRYTIERREIRGPRWIRVHKSSVVAPPFTQTNLYEGSQYEFTVYAQNMIGLSEPSEVSETVCQASQNLEAPRFVGEMVDVSVQEADKADFHCEVCGTPAPDVRWFKNFREVFDGYKHRVTREASNCGLAITNVCPEDCGEVECRAFNKAGNASIRANLILKAPPKIRSNKNLYDGMSFCRGQKIMFRIPVAGRPFPKVTWVKDGEVIEHGGRYEVTSGDLHAMLVVHEAEKSDMGEYSLTLENDLGKDSVAFNIIVTDRPDPPQGQPKVTEVTRNSARVAWQVPAHDGGAFITSYFIEKSEGNSNVWQPCGSTHLLQMTVHRLLENKEYRFRVKAENVHGISDPSEESNVVTTQEPKIEIDYDKLTTQDFQYTKINKDKLPRDLSQKYIICEEIGRGAFGVLHRAIEKCSGKNWAAKFMRCMPVDREIVKREMDIMNDLHHPKLLQLHEAFEVTGEMVMCLEFISGPDLLERVVEEGYELTEAESIHFIRQVSQGLQHIHANSILHLDIKPENVCCSARHSRNVKIIDFGLAQRVEPGATARVLIGSGEYCAPELLNYEPISFAADMWSVGVFAYVLLTGVSPFIGENMEKTFANVVEGKVDMTLPVWKDVSWEAKDWIGKVLIMDRHGRMTVNEGLAHAWLNGTAEGHMKRRVLPTEHHRELMSRQKWRANSIGDSVSLGRLAHNSAYVKRFTQEGLLERELVMEMPDQAPEVVNELSNTEAYISTTGRFKCKFKGHPMPTVSWWHEDTRLAESNKKYDFWYKRGLAMLNINDVTEDDAGQFMCVASNSVGECFTLGELNVQEMLWKRKGESLQARRQRRASYSFERRGSDASLHSLPVMRRGSLTGPGSDSGHRSLGGGYAGSSYAGSETGSSIYGYQGGRRGSEGSIYSARDIDIPPIFQLSLVDQSLRAGTKVVLSVMARCKPEPEVTWYHGQTLIYPSDKYVLTRQRHLWRLEVNNLQASDAGVWKALAVNAYGQALCSCMLTVIENIPDEFEAPVFTTTLRKTMILEGSDARFDVKVRSNPESEVFWYKDRKPILESNQHYEILYEEDETCSLIVHEAQSIDAGHYMCKASNAAGTTLCETLLMVEGLMYDDIYTPRRSSYASSVTSDQESSRSSLSSRRKKRFDAAPTFTAKLRPKKCMVSQNVRFNCSVSGLPMPDVIWTRGNKVITDGGRYRISNNYGLLSLEILDVVEDDAGLYNVTATNVEGEVACSASLEVQDISLGERPEGLTKPTFTMEALNVWAEVGNKATIEAIATGRPMPTFKWQKDNITLTEDDRIHVFSDERGHTKLILKDVCEADSGLYFCVAENKSGKTKCAATVKIVPKGQISEERRRSRSRSRETTPVGGRRPLEREPIPMPRDLDLGPRPVVGTKPYFVHPPPFEVNAQEGDPITIKCVVDGDPKPTVTWCKGARELSYTKRMRVLTDGSHHTLEMSAALITDPGQYLVVAENACGKCQASIWINILPRDAELPDDWELKRYRMEVPDVSIEKSVSVESENVAPHFVKRLPMETEIKEGEDLEIKCKVREGSPRLHTETSYEMKVTGSIKVEEDTLKISTTPGDEKTTVVDSKVIYDSGDLSKEAKAKVKAEEKPAEVKPAKEPAPEAKPVEEPAPVVPEPEAKPAEEPVEEVKPVEEPAPVVEPVPEPEAKPEPEKPAPAEEPALEPEAEPAVKAPAPEAPAPEPVPAVAVAPEFEIELADKKARTGEIIVFIVKLKVAMEITIKWFKDGTLLEAGDRYTITQDGAEYRLEISPTVKADAGMYSCTIVNDAGTITSTAQLKVKKEKKDEQVEEVSETVVTEEPVKEEVPEEPVEEAKEPKVEEAAPTQEEAVTEAEATLVIAQEEVVVKKETEEVKVVEEEVSTVVAEAEVAKTEETQVEAEASIVLPRVVDEEPVKKEVEEQVTQEEVEAEVSITLPRVVDEEPIKKEVEEEVTKVEEVEAEVSIDLPTEVEEKVTQEVTEAEASFEISSAVEQEAVKTVEEETVTKVEEVEAEVSIVLPQPVEQEAAQVEVREEKKVEEAEAEVSVVLPKPEEQEPVQPEVEEKVEEQEKVEVEAEVSVVLPQADEQEPVEAEVEQKVTLQEGAEVEAEVSLVLPQPVVTEEVTTEVVTEEVTTEVTEEVKVEGDVTEAETTLTLEAPVEEKEAEAPEPVSEAPAPQKEETVTEEVTAEIVEKVGVDSTITEVDQSFTLQLPEKTQVKEVEEVHIKEVEKKPAASSSESSSSSSESESEAEEPAKVARAKKVRVFTNVEVIDGILTEVKTTTTTETNEKGETSEKVDTTKKELGPADVKVMFGDIFGKYLVENIPALETQKIFKPASIESVEEHGRSRLVQIVRQIEVTDGVRTEVTTTTTTEINEAGEATEHVDVQRRVLGADDGSAISMMVDESVVKPAITEALQEVQKTTTEAVSEIIVPDIDVEEIGGRARHVHVAKSIEVVDGVATEITTTTTTETNEAGETSTKTKTSKRELSGDELKIVMASGGVDVPDNLLDVSGKARHVQISKKIEIVNGVATEITTTTTTETDKDGETSTKVDTSTREIVGDELEELMKSGAVPVVESGARARHVNVAKKIEVVDGVATEITTTTTTETDADGETTTKTETSTREIVGDELDAIMKSGAVPVVESGARARHVNVAKKIEVVDGVATEITTTTTTETDADGETTTKTETSTREIVGDELDAIMKSGAVPVVESGARARHVNVAKKIEVVDGVATEITTTTTTETDADGESTTKTETSTREIVGDELDAIMKSGGASVIEGGGRARHVNVAKRIEVVNGVATEITTTTTTETDADGETTTKTETSTREIVGDELKQLMPSIQEGGMKRQINVARKIEVGDGVAKEITTTTTTDTSEDGEESVKMETSTREIVGDELAEILKSGGGAVIEGYGEAGSRSRHRHVAKEIEIGDGVATEITTTTITETGEDGETSTRTETSRREIVGDELKAILESEGISTTESGSKSRQVQVSRNVETIDGVTTEITTTTTTETNAEGETSTKTETSTRVITQDELKEMMASGSVSVTEKAVTSTTEASSSSESESESETEKETKKTSEMTTETQKTVTETVIQQDEVPLIESAAKVTETKVEVSEEKIIEEKKASSSSSSSSGSSSESEAEDKTDYKTLKEEVVVTTEVAQTVGAKEDAEATLILTPKSEAVEAESISRHRQVSKEIEIVDGVATEITTTTITETNEAGETSTKTETSRREIVGDELKAIMETEGMSTTESGSKSREVQVSREIKMVDGVATEITTTTTTETDADGETSTRTETSTRVLSEDEAKGMMVVESESVETSQMGTRGDAEATLILTPQTEMVEAESRSRHRQVSKEIEVVDGVATEVTTTTITETGEDGETSTRTETSRREIVGDELKAIMESEGISTTEGGSKSREVQVSKEIQTVDGVTTEITTTTTTETNADGETSTKTETSTRVLSEDEVKGMMVESESFVIEEEGSGKKKKKKKDKKDEEELTEEEEGKKKKKRKDSLKKQESTADDTEEEGKKKKKKKKDRDSTADDTEEESGKKKKKRKESLKDSAAEEEGAEGEGKKKKKRKDSLKKDSADESEGEKKKKKKKKDDSAEESQEGEVEEEGKKKKKKKKEDVIAEEPELEEEGEKKKKKKKGKSKDAESLEIETVEESSETVMEASGGTSAFAEKKPFERRHTSYELTARKSEQSKIAGHASVVERRLSSQEIKSDIKDSVKEIRRRAQEKRQLAKKAGSFDDSLRKTIEDMKKGLSEEDLDAVRTQRKAEPVDDATRLKVEMMKKKIAEERMAAEKGE